MQRLLSTLLFVFAMLEPGCYRGVDIVKNGADDDQDSDDTSADTDIDVDVDTDVDADTDSDTDAPSVECAILDPMAYGDCEGDLGWGFVGVGCMPISGCTCEPDCDYLFDSEQECEESCDCQGLGGHCKQLADGECAVCEEGFQAHGLDGDCPDETWCCIPPQGPPTQCSEAGGVCAPVFEVMVYCPPGWDVSNAMCFGYSSPWPSDCCMQSCS